MTTLRENKGPAMIIESSDQVPRATLLKRVPVPRNFRVTPESRIGRGKIWPAPAPAAATASRRSKFIATTRIQSLEIVVEIVTTGATRLPLPRGLQVLHPTNPPHLAISA